jgi:hypothetical protein
MKDINVINLAGEPINTVKMDRNYGGKGIGLPK